MQRTKRKGTLYGSVSCHGHNHKAHLKFSTSDGRQAVVVDVILILGCHVEDIAWGAGELTKWMLRSLLRRVTWRQSDHNE